MDLMGLFHVCHPQVSKICRITGILSVFHFNTDFLPDLILTEPVVVSFCASLLHAFAAILRLTIVAMGRLCLGRFIRSDGVSISSEDLQLHIILSSISPAFAKLYDFNPGQAGTIFSTIA
jgi:hypothetical protein